MIPLDEALVREFRHHASVMILELDGQRRIERANPYAKTLLGGDPVGRTLHEVFLDFRSTLDIGLLIENGGEQLAHVAIPGRLPQTLRFRFIPGEPYAAVVGEIDYGDIEALRRDLVRTNNELNNLTRELHKKNAELTRLNEIKNHFLGMAAHDLRNPLNAIMLYSEFMLQDPQHLPKPEYLEFLKDIKDLSDFMLSLINDLLDISIIEAGKMALTLKEVDFPELLSKTVELNRVFAERKGIVLRLSQQITTAKIFIDTPKIRQVLNNLIGNAIKFSPAGTQIHVRARSRGRELEVAIHDQGPGIPPQEMDRLFTPFPRISVQSTGGEKSIGLGLVISQKIVQAHRGSISAESEVGRGTTFTFTLPVLTI